MQLQLQCIRYMSADNICGYLPELCGGCEGRSLHEASRPLHMKYVESEVVPVCNWIPRHRHVCVRARVCVYGVCECVNSFGALPLFDHYAVFKFRAPTQYPRRRQTTIIACRSTGLALPTWPTTFESFSPFFHLTERVSFSVKFLYWRNPKTTGSARHTNLACPLHFAFISPRARNVRHPVSFHTLCTSSDRLILLDSVMFMRFRLVTDVTVRLKPDGTRWRTGGEVKGKLAKGVGSQYSSHHLGNWCTQHHYRWYAHHGCQHST